MTKNISLEYALTLVTTMRINTTYLFTVIPIKTSTFILTSIKNGQ